MKVKIKSLIKTPENTVNYKIKKSCIGQVFNATKSKDEHGEGIFIVVVPYSFSSFKFRFKKEEIEIME